eukprot:TRINITY_DN164_c3_g2_i4.p1 TRINITY_DN164_c3_g2~~TRINITY_DN164_c3_g2_i4.p1  ORF type:complete len:755 (+),score=228.60 TRINITY_DN164_c3_g2_i4:172-2265(+)
MGHFSTESIVGWLDLAVFNLIMLSGNFRPGFKITGMALNCGFMMCFLNPMDQTVFSKNFKINPNGAAVSAFLGTCLGSCCAVLALLLPYPLGWARICMKHGAKQCSEDTCKLFFAAVDYYCGDDASVLIDRQLAQAAKLKAAIGGLGAQIDAAYVECLDFGSEGTVRNLYQMHADMVAQIFDMLNALQIAMSSEDFGPSHKECMATIEDSAQSLVEVAGLLLVTATEYSDDGLIEPEEDTDLHNREELVKVAIKKLAADFDRARRNFDKPVSTELMSESFFVFCLTAYARLVISYSEKLRNDPGKGQPITDTVIESTKAILKPPLAYHSRVVSRYWLSLLTCFVFAVAIDNYSPSCAITAVFLINTRVGPDVMAMIQGLLSVVVGIVMNTLMYSFSCKYGNTASLMIISVFYWLSTIFVAYGGSSLAGIGLIMAALAPFAILKRCAALSPEAEAASAVGLWGGIRALLIAVVVTVIWEILHIPGSFTRMSRESLQTAFKELELCMEGVFKKKDVTDGLGKVAAALGDAQTYNSAAIMEPRLWKCRWKKEYLDETAENVNKVRLDIMVIRHALLGGKGADDKNFGQVMQYLTDVPKAKNMIQDLKQTLDDAKELSLDVLQWDAGEYTGLQKLQEMQGLDELDGFEDAVTELAEKVKFPGATPENLEQDELCQLSIVLVMLDYMVKHIADITKGAVKLA